MRPRKHVYQFAHRLLPELFFADPDHVITKLSQPGGLAWLRDRWTDLGQLFADAVDADALRYDFEPVDDSLTLILIRFPTPVAAMEPWFAAIAHRAPVTRMLVFAAPREARYFVLERGNNDADAKVGEWLASGHRAESSSLQPTRQAFVDWLMRELGPA
jgi:hypothetical protein